MKIVRAAAAATVMLAAVPANAEILTAGARVGNFTSSDVYKSVPVPINGSYAGVQFRTSSPGQFVRITYNAECGALGNPGNWLAIVITVDDIATDPASGTSFAFCTAVSMTNYAWVGAVRQATIRLANSGLHTVRVMGYGAGVTSWWLGDSSIVVDR